VPQESHPLPLRHIGEAGYAVIFVPRAAYQFGGGISFRRRLHNVPVRQKASHALIPPKKTRPIANERKTANSAKLTLGRSTFSMGLDRALSTNQFVYRLLPAQGRYIIIRQSRLATHIPAVTRFASSTQFVSSSLRGLVTPGLTTRGQR